jgi:alpha-beta hydrolase superfamily lysophospholipase
MLNLKYPILIFSNINSLMPEIKYVEDVLKNGFEQTIIVQPDDYEGKVITTLIRKRNATPSSKAILYVHGFNDYFFQKEMAEAFIKEGYHFYAIDLRKYGRSIQSNQKMNNVKCISEYYEDLDAALLILKKEGNDKIVLSGHSTGGLIVTLYAADRIGKELFDVLFCNSPFYDMNMPGYQKKILVPFVSLLGRIVPNLPISGSFSEYYGMSLHKTDFGEWDYNLVWKPHIVPCLNAGWINAIHQGHLKMEKVLKINKSILVLHSKKSIYISKWDDEIFSGDAILNVNDIRDKALNISAPKKDVIAIDGAVHDMVLSKKTVRELVLKTLFDWLEINL